MFILTSSCRRENTLSWDLSGRLLKYQSFYVDSSIQSNHFEKTSWNYCVEEGGLRWWRYEETWILRDSYQVAQLSYQKEWGY